LPPHVLALGTVRGDELVGACATRHVHATSATLRHLAEPALPAIIGLVRAAVAAHMLSARTGNGALGRGWSCQGDPGRRVTAGDVDALLAGVRGSLEGCAGAVPPIADAAWGARPALPAAPGAASGVGALTSDGAAPSTDCDLVVPYTGDTVAAMVVDVCASPCAGPALRAIADAAFRMVSAQAAAHIARAPDGSSAAPPAAVVGTLSLAMRAAADALLATGSGGPTGRGAGAGAASPASPAAGDRGEPPSVPPTLSSTVARSSFSPGASRSDVGVPEPAFAEVANAQPALQRLTDVVMWQARL
jgi:hypothetical protein